MKIDLKFAELHNALFLAGKNFGLKLDPTKLTGLKLEYDRAEKELLVYWADEVGIIPSSNVACMTAGIVEDRPIAMFMQDWGMGRRGRVSEFM